MVNVGPDHYNPTQELTKPAPRGANWNASKSKRFYKKEPAVPGPGQYN
jgi:hypothetical protein